MFTCFKKLCSAIAFKFIVEFTVLILVLKSEYILIEKIFSSARIKHKVITRKDSFISTFISIGTLQSV